MDDVIAAFGVTERWVKEKGRKRKLKKKKEKEKEKEKKNPLTYLSLNCGL